MAPLGWAERAAWAGAVVGPAAMAQAAVMTLVVALLLEVVSVAFYYIALGGRVLGASPEGFLPRVFVLPFLPVLYPGQCYHTATEAVPYLAAVLVPVSVVLPILPLASEAAQEAWEFLAAIPGKVALVIFWEVPAWRAVPAWRSAGVTHLAAVAEVVWRQLVGESAQRQGGNVRPTTRGYGAQPTGKYTNGDEIFLWPYVLKQPLFLRLMRLQSYSNNYCL